MINKWLLISFLLFSLVGFTDATYLTVKHYTGGTVSCNLLKGCEVVTTGLYSTIVGVPVALLGSIYYVLVLILSVAYLDTKNQKIIYLLSRFTVIGFLASAYFVYLQAFVIGQWCEYCLLSAGTSTGLFLTGLFFIKSQKSKVKSVPRVFPRG